MARSRRRIGSPQATIHAEVVGLAEVTAALRALPEASQRTIVRDGLDKGGDVVLAEQRRQVPVRTGQLFNSLQEYPITRGKKVSRIWVGTGPEGFYGKFLEYGTSRLPARPWLRPALATAFRPTVAAFRDAVTDGLDPMVDDVARRHGSRA
jgi:HK97 gp10 family phage protein